MSADNVTTCHACRDAALAKRDDAIAAVQKKYGKVPVADYGRLLATAEKMPDAKHSTLAEYYNIGMTDGILRIDYSAGCDVCGFAFEFIHEVKATDQSKEKKR